MGWGRAMVDMSRTTEEKVEAMEAPVPSQAADYPYGLCICLTHEELAKLDLDDDVEPGDTVHLVAFAKVTNVFKSAPEGSPICRVELQITDLAVEDESTETMPDREGEADAPPPAKKRGRY